MARNNVNLCEGPFLKKVVLYSVPILFTGLLQLAFNAADLIIVGIDNSVFQMRPEVLAKFKEVYAKNKPVIVLMHVPIYPAVNQDMKWITPRHNIWGARRRPHKPMAEFIKLVKTPNGPVKAVFNGHNHKSWEGLLAPGVKMNIFNPAFEGNIGVITVTPASKK